MKISALVAEFNPFHTGHTLLVDSMKRQSDGIIAIMSGNFVQRGECALFDKEERAIAAIKNGVDLVIELPAAFALSSAEGFARGAVETLVGTGVVDELHFGSECGSIDDLCAVADILNNENDTFSQTISQKTAEGLSFPAARKIALQTQTPLAFLLDSPNNTLAIEYIRCLKKLSSRIKPVTIKRMGSDYNDTSIKDNIASASAIRTMLKNGEDASSHMLYDFKNSPVFMKDFDLIVSSRLKTISVSELCMIPDCNIHIASRLKNTAKYNTFNDILSASSSKTYTQSRIRRILCNMIIANTFTILPSPEYIRPLAFNKTGSEILHKIKDSATLPVAPRGAVLKDSPIFALECRATDIYNLVRNIEGGREYEYAVQIL